MKKYVNVNILFSVLLGAISLASAMLPQWFPSGVLGLTPGIWWSLLELNSIPGAYIFWKDPAGGIEWFLIKL